MSATTLTRELEERARRALDKPAEYGEDIDLGSYSSEAQQREAEELGQLTSEQGERFLRAGVELSGKGRSGSYIQLDHSILHRMSNIEKLEVMGIEQALEAYPELGEKYWWQAMAVDTDKYTAQVALNLNHGYFLRAKPGARTTFPLQACLFIGQEGLAQNVHNIILAEEASELNIITGCAADIGVRRALHLGVTEIYIKRGAKVTFTMIHNWAEEISVRARSEVFVEEGGLFFSNYIIMQPVHTVQMYPTVHLLGEEAVARLNSVVVATPGSRLDIGARVLLQAPRSRAEILSRSVSTGGTVIARGHLRGDAPGIKAHLECDGLMLDEGGVIHAIPELEGGVADVDMSHEAAIGKIAGEQIDYLMARGLTQAEATAAIVRGFLKVDITGLPDALQAELDEVVEACEASLF